MAEILEYLWRLVGCGICCSLRSRVEMIWTFIFSNLVFTHNTITTTPRSFSLHFKLEFKCIFLCHFAASHIRSTQHDWARISTSSALICMMHDHFKLTLGCVVPVLLYLSGRVGSGLRWNGGSIWRSEYVDAKLARIHQAGENSWVWHTLPWDRQDHWTHLFLLQACANTSEYFVLQSFRGMASADSRAKSSFFSLWWCWWRGDFVPWR